MPGPGPSHRAWLLTSWQAQAVQLAWLHSLMTGLRKLNQYGVVCCGTAYANSFAWYAAFQLAPPRQTSLCLVACEAGAKLLNRFQRLSSLSPFVYIYIYICMLYASCKVL